MNRVTRRSFYSFLALYLITSFVFLSIAAYWFYNSQVSIEMQRNYYKMNHIADVVSVDVIHASMNHTPFTLRKFNKNSVALLDFNKTVRYGMLVDTLDFSRDFYMRNGMFTLISKRPAGHLGIHYVVVQSNECVSNVKKIQNKITYAVVITATLIIFIAVFLSYIFLRPVKEKMQEMEDFVKDTTHELNTPITALMMSVSRLKNKKECDAKALQNISISTKQLHDIYASLTYINFDTKEADEVLDMKTLVEEQLNYTKELLERKKLSIVAQLASCRLTIAPTKAKMLISNLLNNAIKYSHQNSSIEITLSSNSLSIRDYGVGIAKDKLHIIFKRFVRASDYSGGFGVGLSTVKNIVDEYGYTIEIDSQENVGTTIHIHFKKK